MYKNQDWILPSSRTAAKKTAYINARLFDPESGLDKKGALLTEGAKIANFGPKLFSRGVPEGIEVIDCQGHLLTPGLLDIHVHFREPGHEYKEDLHSGSKSAVAGGITTVVCMPNTKPAIDNVSLVKDLMKRAKEKAFCHIMFEPCITEGMQNEKITDIEKLSKTEGVVGFTDDGRAVMNAQLMRKAFEAAAKTGKVIAQHAEDPNLSNCGCMNEGHISKKLGVAGVPNISEATIVARDIVILEKTGGHYHVMHISTKQAVDSVREAKKKGLNVTCEAAPHHFTLTDKAVLQLSTIAKMNPPLRSEQDRLAVIKGLKDGTIEVIASDHAPHDADSKNVSLQKATVGLVGLETILPLSLELYHKKILSLKEVLAKLTCNAADIIGEKRGRLKKGYPADLTIINLNHEWKVDVTKFASKSKNSPFDGRKVKGRAVRTVIAGKTVYILS